MFFNLSSAGMMATHSTKEAVMQDNFHYGVHDEDSVWASVGRSLLRAAKRLDDVSTGHCAALPRIPRHR